MENTVSTRHRYISDNALDSTIKLYRNHIEAFKDIEAHISKKRRNSPEDSEQKKRYYLMGLAMFEAEDALLTAINALNAYKELQ